MKKVLQLVLFSAIVSVVMMASGGYASAADYNYISPEEVKKIIEQKDPSYAIIDIQLKKNFDEKHLKGAIPTYAFPGNKPEMHEMLKQGLDSIKDDQKIIVVCPRGGGGAKNSVNYYRSIGIDNDRLFILEKGQEGWPKNMPEVIEAN